MFDQRLPFEPAFGRSRRGRGCRLVTLCAACATALLSANVTALPDTFSVDVQGPTAGTGIPGSFTGFPIRGSDILTPFPPGPPGPNPPASGPLPSPGIFRRLTVAPSPFLNDTNGWGEGDAVSYGRDPLDVPFPTGLSHVFSVDEFAIGLPGSAVRTEGALGNMEASADTFIKRKLPLPTPPIPNGNAPCTDGNGAPLSGAPRVGLIEPNPPTPLSGGRPGQIDPGDNLDALDYGTALSDRESVYFSLDSAFFDPLETVPREPPPNYGTAAANGLVGGDALLGGDTPPVLYAAAPALGLADDDSDDLDALKLAENGIDGYQESIEPFDWLTGTTIDMLPFSVRQNSAVISMLASIFGIPIEEGDILTTPCLAGTVLPDRVVCVGGSNPGIFVAAEALGLATVRSGAAAAGLYGVINGVINPVYGQDIWADDLDAYDQMPEPGTHARAVRDRPRRARIRNAEAYPLGLT